MTITIRSIETVEEQKSLERLQKDIWNTTDLEVIPARTLNAIRFNGNLLLGAFDGERLVGFIFGVIGTVRGLDRVDEVAAARLQLYSVIMGVHPDCQHEGIGYRLKLAQREFAIRLGIRLVTWTYDPLISRNAWLNIGKLGAICHEYLPDFYGEMGGLNEGMATDRFYIEWWVTGNRVRSRVSQRRGALGYEQLIAGRSVLINETRFGDSGLPVPPPDFLESDANLVLVEIPYDIDEIKDKDLELAREWRAHTRLLFEQYFARQYIVTDFTTRVDEAGHKRSYYVLTSQHA